MLIMMLLNTRSVCDVNPEECFTEPWGNGKPHSRDDIELGLELQVRVCQRSKGAEYIRHPE